MPGVKLREDPKIPSNILTFSSVLNFNEANVQTIRIPISKLEISFSRLYLNKKRKRKKKSCIKYNRISFDRQSLVLPLSQLPRNDDYVKSDDKRIGHSLIWRFAICHRRLCPTRIYRCAMSNNYREPV